MTAPHAQSSGWLLYRADEIAVGDSIVGLGEVKRIVRRLGEIDLYWCMVPVASFVRVGPGTQLLVRRPVHAAAVSVDMASRARSA